MRTSPAHPLPLALTLAAWLATGGCGGQPSAITPGSPEEVLTYVVSHILVPVPPENPSLAFRVASDVLGEIRSGIPFADVARARSADRESAELGGFLGFVRPRADDAFSGAVQALVPGVAAGPVQAQSALHVFLRHTLDEGRRIEASCSIPAYGFVVPLEDPRGGEPRTREAARALAERLFARVKQGELSLAEAAKEVHATADVPPDAFWGFVRPAGKLAALYDALARTPDGAFVPVEETPVGFAVLKRGRLYRVGVRHILVHHVYSPNRALAVRRLPPEARAIAEKALAEAKPDGSNWADLVPRYSDDAVSVPLDGSIGVLGNGDLDPRMEAVLLATEPGRVASSVAESEQGFHVLYRLD